MNRQAEERIANSHFLAVRRHTGVAMRILHTSDWHLGISLRDHPREAEHAAFLSWLTDTVVEREVDVVLVAGDIFDTANPPSRALTQWYGWLASLLARRPGVHVVAIGGNHDSAARLDAPADLLRALSVHTVGGLRTDEAGEIVIADCIVPLADGQGVVRAVVGAVPFLGALSVPEIERVYGRTSAALRELAPPEAALLLMGHCFAVGARAARRSGDSERMMAGGVEHVPVSVFPEDVAYTALGHLHLGQEPGPRVAYSGSPLPLSFSERDYAHRVLLVDLQPQPAGRAVAAVEPLPIPRSVAVESWPLRGEAAVQLSPADALLRVQMRPMAAPGAANLPLVQIRLAPGATAVHKREIEEAAVGRNFRCLHVELNTERSAASAIGASRLDEITPREVFVDEWARRFPDEPLPDDVLAAFDEAAASVAGEGA